MPNDQIPTPLPLRASTFPDTGTREYSEFIHRSRYARFLHSEERRETWPETVGRYFAFMRKRFPQVELDEVEQAVLRLDVVPSMRALWSAGSSLERCNVAGYNCAYLAVDDVRAFDEAVYILMSGCGLGFSVERQYVAQLPPVPAKLEPDLKPIDVEDSREGWAHAFRELLFSLYVGFVPTWDLSQLRPAGAKLYTSGGRSSGPGPLDDLFAFTVALFQGAKGRRLSSIECHDLMCKIGCVVVAGGVRRSALISLSNPSDDRMRHAKSGNWQTHEPQRALANNSAAYTERPDFGAFMREWGALYESKSGERGIFNRCAASRKALNLGRDEVDYGTNPCGEISLRSMQFCNLTEVIVRAGDSIEDIAAKVRAATVLGTLQSALTDFKYLRDEWKVNCEDERLLGVSLTGILDHELLGDATRRGLAPTLAGLRLHAKTTNARVATRIGVGPSTAITTVKPSGTVSQLANTSSGIHPRHAAYYIRRVRAAASDPLAQLMLAEGFPSEVDLHTPTNLVFSFPVKAPEGAVFEADVDALTQAKLWLVYAEHWADHSVSCTIKYDDAEFLALGAWVWEHFDRITGLAFLPRSGHVYAQAPYETITEAQYDELAASMPRRVDWSRLSEYEREDNTRGAQTLACASGACEMVDLVEA